MTIRGIANPFSGIVQNNGTLRLITPVYASMDYSIVTGKVPAANAPSWTSFTTNTSKYTFAIDDYTDLTSLIVPRGYCEETDFLPYLYMYTNGLDVDERTVKFEATRVIVNPNNGAASEIVVDGQFTIPASTPDRSLLKLEPPPLDGTGVTIGADFTLRIKRLAIDTGTEPTSDPFLSSIGLDIEINSIGSRQRNVK